MKQTIFKLVAVLALAGSLAACKKEVSPYADEAVPTVTLSSPVSTFTLDKANVVLELSHFIHKDVNVTFEVTGIEAEAVDFPMEYVIEAGALKKTIPIAIDEELASLGDKTVAISIAKVENAVVASSAPVNIGINIEDVAMVNVSATEFDENLEATLTFTLSKKVSKDVTLGIVSAAVGSLVYRIILQLAYKIEMPSYAVKLLSAAIVVVALTIPRVRRLIAERRASREGDAA